MAVFIDGGFFLKRLRHQYPSVDASDAKAVADIIHRHALHHREQITGANSAGKVVETFDLHRIFFYDCAPLQKKMHWPISRRSEDFAKSSTARFRLALHDELRRKRKVALRLGHLLDTAEWRLRPEALKKLLRGETSFEKLTDADFVIDTIQKGVDMRLGIDVAAISYKKQAEQIVLIVGDSDFVPAAKLARREGLDVILDPLGTQVHASLNEHIDGVRHVRMHAATPRAAAAIIAQKTLNVVETSTIGIIAGEDELLAD